jgi:hypothetical protein
VQTVDTHPSHQGNSTIRGAQQLPAASSTPPTQEPKDRLYTLVNKYDDVYNGILRDVQNLQQRMAELNHLTDQFYDLKAYYLANRLDAEANKIELLRPTREYLPFAQSRPQ